MKVHFRRTIVALEVYMASAEMSAAFLQELPSVLNNFPRAFLSAHPFTVSIKNSITSSNMPSVEKVPASTAIAPAVTTVETTNGPAMKDATPKDTTHPTGEEVKEEVAPNVPPRPTPKNPAQTGAHEPVDLVDDLLPAQLRWEHVSKPSVLPPDALVAGEPSSTDPLHIARVDARSELAPGGLRSSEGVAVAVGGDAALRVSTGYDVLCGPMDGLKWVDGSAGEVGPGAVVAGLEFGVSKVYAGRVRMNRRWVIGKVVPYARGAFFVDESGKVSKRGFYQVLCEDIKEEKGASNAAEDKVKERGGAVAKYAPLAITVAAAMVVGFVWARRGVRQGA